MTWREHAACRDSDPALFFPPNLGGGRPESLAYKAKARRALAMCAVCVVRTECLDEALEEERDAVLIDGIRGGLLPSQRAAMARARARINPGRTA